MHQANSSFNDLKGLQEVTQNTAKQELYISGYLECLK